MDLQDFEAQALYFEEVMPDGVDALINRASELYSEGEAEGPLLSALALAPESMTVLVALYRFYYYQHRLEDALEIGERVMSLVAPTIGFPDSWRKLTFNHLANGVMESFTRVRFYLLALKGAAYLCLRMNRRAEAVDMLNKIISFDTEDRLGARSLLVVAGPQLVASNDTPEAVAV